MAEHLPPGNAAQRELHGRWGDDQILAHDISSSLRSLTTLMWNINRGKDQAEKEPTFLPTPAEAEAAAAQVRPAEQVEAERNHLQAILARPQPK